MQRRMMSLAILMLAMLLMSVTAHAASRTWTGTTSNAWNDSSNWGGLAFPNSYNDQATIPGTTGLNKPVILSTTALLGIASGNALTLGGASTGATVPALDISSTGTLGMQGGISIGTRRQLTIEGVLRNDAASSATTYTISGTPILNGGTISSLNGGIWNVGGLTGYGTVSAPLVTSGNISATIANQTLHITGDVTSNSQRGLGGGSTTHASGALLSIEGGTINGGPVIGGAGFDNYNNVDLRGTFNNITLYRDGSGNYNLTGDSTWNNGALNTMNFNGYKLNVNGTVTNYGTVNVGNGTLYNPGTSLSTISNGNIITLAGAQIAGASGSNGFSFATNLRGYGTISTPVTITANGGLQVSGGALNINNTTLNNIGGAFITNANDGTVNVNNSTVNFGNFTNAGLVNNALDGIITGTGNYLQTAGKTLNNGTMTQASVTINGGILGGTGTINAPVTIGSGGTVSPGNSPGVLTVNGDFTSSGNMLFEIAGLGAGQFDRMIVNGIANILGGNIDISFINGYSHAGYWDIFDATRIASWNPTSVEVSGLSSEYVWSIIPEFNSDRVLVGEGLQVSLAQTPEPGTLLLLCTGIFGFGGIRLRVKTLRHRRLTLLSGG